MFCLLFMCVCVWVGVCVGGCVTDHILQAVSATGDLALLTLWLLQIASNPSFINCKIHVTYKQKKGNKSGCCKHHFSYILPRISNNVDGICLEVLVFFSYQRM